jgi:hypothetical protein
MTIRKFKNFKKKPTSKNRLEEIAIAKDKIIQGIIS